MKFKIQVQTELDPKLLNKINDSDPEAINQFIHMLEDSKSTIRPTLYSLFLGKRSVKYAASSIILCLLGFSFTESVFYIYMMFISVLLTFLFALSFAEYTSHLSTKSIDMQISKLKELLEKVRLNKENAN